MPITFSCSCGKVMKAKDAFAGRKIKCIQCGTVVRIPPLEPAGIPVARPVSQPVLGFEQGHERPSMPPLAKPVARLVTPENHGEHRPAAAAVHAWVDQSLMQQPTPWRPGDQERFQAGMPPSERMSGVMKGVLALIILAVAGVGGWFLIMNR
jgi:hypothetical protein